MRRAIRLLAVLALGVAVVAAIAAIGSWKVARSSNEAAATLSRIEQQRLHTDLTPDFRCSTAANEARATAVLRVHFEGPAGLLSHGAVEITASIRTRLDLSAARSRLVPTWAVKAMAHRAQHRGVLYGR